MCGSDCGVTAVLHLVTRNTHPPWPRSWLSQRVNTAESEDGFQWRDNSCFGRFKSMDEFVAYLKNTQGGDGGSAGSVFVSALNVVLALALALFLLR